MTDVVGEECSRGKAGSSMRRRWRSSLVGMTRGGGMGEYAFRQLLARPVLVAAGMGSFDLGFIRGANESRRSG